MTPQYNYFPKRLLSKAGNNIRIKAPSDFGVATENFIHTIAKTIHLYKHPIICQANGVCPKGDIIPIDTLGIFLFGTHGYEANIDIWNEKNHILISYALEAPSIVETFMHKIKHKIENL